MFLGVLDALALVSLLNTVVQVMCVHWYFVRKQRNKESTGIENKYVRLRGRTYIHTCRSNFERYIATVCVARALADSPADFGLLGKQSSPKWEIPRRGRR